MDQTSAAHPPKLNLPTHRGLLIERPRLITHLNNAPVTALIGPAGSGKTTLAFQWAKAFEGAVCWLSLKPEDDDARRFGLFVLQMLRLILPDLSELPALLLSQAVDGDYEPFIDALTAELGSLEVPLAFVVDEAQILTKSVLIQSIVRFMEQMPACIRVVFVGRSLHRMLLQGARTFTMHELAFTQYETARYFASQSERLLDSTAITRIFSVTQGWVMGVKLAGIALLGDQASPERAAEYSVHYLMDEAMRQIAPAQLRFMMRTCIADPLIVPLCDALTNRKDSVDQLEGLLNAGLFVTREKEKPPIYRYHPLFREALMERLQRENPRILQESQRRAAAWYAETGQYRAAALEAMDAGDIALAADYALQASRQIVLFNDLFTFYDWLEKFPASWLDEHPRLRLFALMATVLAKKDAAAAQAHLDRLLAHRDAENWRGEIELARGYIAWKFGDPSTDLTLHFRQALEVLERDALYAHALHVLSLIYETLQQPAKALEVLEEQYRVAMEIESPEVTLHALNNLIYVRQNVGDYDSVLSMTALALEITASSRDQLGHFALDAERAIRRQRAGVLMNRGQFAEAEETLLPAFAFPERAHPHLLWLLYSRRAEIDALRGDLGSMAQAFEYGALLHGMLEQRVYDADLVSLALEAQRTRILLRWNDADAARRWLEICPKWELEAAIETRTLQVTPQARLALGDIPTALKELERVQERYAVRDMQMDVAQTIVLRALAHWLNGDEVAALSALDEAIDRTLPSGNVLALAHVALFPLLRRRVVELWREGEDARAEHLRRSIAILADDPPTLPLTPLTPAEQKVAGLLLQGLTVSQIADSLWISDAGVRFQVRHLHHKLCTRDRHALLERLRALSLPSE